MKRTLLAAMTLSAAIAAAVTPAWPQQAAGLPPPALAESPALATPTGGSTDCRALGATLRLMLLSIPVMQWGIQKLDADSAQARLHQAQLDEASKNTIPFVRQSMQSAGCPDSAADVAPAPASAPEGSTACPSLWNEAALFRQWASAAVEAARVWEATAAEHDDTVRELQALAESRQAEADRDNHEAEAERLRVMRELAAKYRAALDAARKQIAYHEDRLGSPECDPKAPKRAVPDMPGLLPPPVLSGPALPGLLPPVVPSAGRRPALLPPPLITGPAVPRGN